MRAHWSDRPNCSHNVSQKVRRIRRVSDGSPFLQNTLMRSLLGVLVWRRCCPSSRNGNLGWPFQTSASASVFYSCFFLLQKAFPGNRCIKRQLTQFCAFNSRNLNFRMLTLFVCTRFPPPTSHLKPPRKCPISASLFSKKIRQPPQAVKTTAVVSAPPLCNPLTA